jgi:hypothetical protein
VSSTVQAFYNVLSTATSRVLFDDLSLAVNLAFKMVEQSIAKAKAERGSFIRRYLAEGGD